MSDHLDPCNGCGHQRGDHKRGTSRSFHASATVTWGYCQQASCPCMTFTEQPKLNRVDFTRTGTSDIPNDLTDRLPPHGHFTVIGKVTAERRTYRGTGGVTTHAHMVTVRDHTGRTHTLALHRPASDPAPRVGETVAAEITRGAFPQLRETAADRNRKDRQLPLPTQKTSRQGRDPRDARVLLSSPPKIGKTTLLSQWAPDTTLILDTHKGTALLDGEHYVQHIGDFAAFETAVDEFVAGNHTFRTIGIDLVEDVWKMADRQAGAGSGKVAAGLVEYGKGTAEAEGLFRRACDKLLASSYGIWFITHVDVVQDKDTVQRVARLDKRIRTYIEGAVDFNLIGESTPQGRVLHTCPSARFQAGSRVPLQPMMPLDARALYVEIAKGLSVPKPAAEVTPRASLKEEPQEKVAA